jgi:hypothetical protein
VREKRKRDTMLLPAETMRSEPDEVLDARIRAADGEWADVLDLLITAGSLPSSNVAARVMSFFEEAYWVAEEARVEMLRRQLPYDFPRRRTVVHRTGPERGLG